MNEPTTQFKLFQTSYRWHGPWQTFEYYECVVVTETADKALSWAVMKYPDTDIKCWSVEEISLEKEGLTQISHERD